MLHRQAEKFGHTATKFIEEMAKEMGVKVVIYAAWVTKDHDLRTTQWVVYHCL
jgi:hypothetical protein